MSKPISVTIKTEPAEVAVQPYLESSQQLNSVYSGNTKQEAEESTTENVKQPDKTVPGSSNGAAKVILAYKKRKALKHFQVHGCGSRSFELAVKSIKLDEELAREYFNRHAEQAQEFVGEECDSLCFENVNLWLMMLEGAGLNEFCDYEQALIVKAIAENEEMPSPQDLNGVDLKAVYKFLGNALMGLPQPKLEPKSAKFLADEFEALIDDVNSDAAEQETKDIKNTLLRNAEAIDVNKARAKMSLDPLSINAALEEHL